LTERKTKLRAAAVLGAVFALGGVTGAGVMRWQMADELSSTLKLPPHEARARFRLRAMRHHLNLNDEQAAKIETILLEADRERGEIATPCRPTLDAQRERVRQKIDEVLTPEQRREHQALRERWDKKRKGE
jgi:Spy/CpxP family protein refolding chaperone